MVAQRFRAEGVDVRVGHKAKRFLKENDKKVLVCEYQGSEVRIEFDALLCAVGRVARTKGYGLEELGIPLTKARTVETNEFLQTLYPNIYACGDVAGPYQFTHTAAHQAWYRLGERAVRLAEEVPRRLLGDPLGDLHRPGGGARRPERDRGEGARACRTRCRSTTSTSSTARSPTSAAHGMVKVLTVPGKDRILGATIAGEHAGDLIAEFVAAMRHGFGLNKILGTIHIYPTMAEANKYAAGVWKKAHAPQRLLARIEKLHAWMRG